MPSPLLEDVHAAIWISFNSNFHHKDLNGLQLAFDGWNLKKKKKKKSKHIQQSTPVYSLQC